jgi:DNA-binding transcriptional MerR regulator
MYRIGLFSKINKVTIKTLRYYDETGLLKPAFVDKETGYRYYTSGQLPQLHQIVSLRQMGFSIQEIADIMNGRNIQGIFAQRKAELVEMMEESRRQLVHIEHYLSEMKEGFQMGYQVVLKELPECVVYSVRMKLPDFDSYFACIPAIGSEVLASNPGLQLASPEYCFSIYHDGEYKEKDIDTEFCEAVTSWGNDTDRIVFKQIERCPTAACVIHKGPYKTLRMAYAYLFKWIEDNGYTPAAPPREAYTDGIWNKPDESEWLTEIQVPIVKK